MKNSLFFLLFLIYCKEKTIEIKANTTTQIIVNQKGLPIFFIYGLPFAKYYLSDGNPITLK